MSTSLITNGPRFVVPYRPDRGGVDFLGMRQVNVNMMAGVLPGINNVTWWLRPFSVVSWIYWKFFHLASEAGISEPTGEQLRIWKEKVEVLFTWGHKLDGRQGLPGISFNPPGGGAASLSFSDWGRTALNTSLMAAVQYGPAAKTLDGLGFLEPWSGPFFKACGEGPDLAQALDACVSNLDAFGLLNSLGADSATPEQARALFQGWSVNNPTVKEKQAFCRAFFQAPTVGQDSRIGRRSTTVQLILDLLSASDRPLAERAVRAGLFFGRPNTTQKRTEREELKTGWLRWQVLQIRQLQRLALEALLSWFEVRLSVHNDKGTEQITAAAMNSITSDPNIFPLRQTVAECRRAFASECPDNPTFLALSEGSALWSPFDLMDTIQANVRQQDDAIVPYALRALFVCARFTDLMFGTKTVRPELMQGIAERMSLSFLRDTTDRCSGLEVVEFTRFLFENLVLSQHFSVAARRFDGETQRLRISIEEEGLEFLADKPLVPFVTPDRLATALSLMADCGLIQWEGAAQGYTAVEDQTP
jgi:hypothetical protein